MLLSLNHLCSYEISARDGHLGCVHDFLFDDHEWVIRYLVVDTGNWLPGKKVLVTPNLIGETEWQTQSLHLDLTKKEIEESPSLESHNPVARRKEIEMAEKFSWPVYWGDPMGGMYPAPIMTAPPEALPEEGEIRDAEDEDTHLRSVREVRGYHSEAEDGEVGHIEDFIAEEGTWTIRYLVVDTGHWISGKKVLVVPMWTEYINWSDRVVRLDLTKKEIEDGPEFDPNKPVNREYETRFYDFYGRPRYWT